MKGYKMKFNEVEKTIILSVLGSDKKRMLEYAHLQTEQEKVDRAINYVKKIDALIDRFNKGE